MKKSNGAMGKSDGSTKKSAGFTLLEITVVLAIFMAVTGAVLIGARGHNNDYRKLQNAALTLQADIRYAHRRAIIEARRVGIQFDRLNNKYEIILPQYTVIRAVNLPQGMDLSVTENYRHDGFRDRLMFYPHGTPSGSGTITLRYGDFEQTITTLPSSGRVEIKEITSTRRQ
ncbi:MAG: GspH/FimT family pseudopilin [Defluviitaleaceae bacterium]|nr:GspH/FimT family pseudopilin [Defluviitaleaceae bacterium]